MTRALLDCTGQKFGYLTVLGKGSRRDRPSSNTSDQLWQLQCDCGAIIEKPRRDFACPSRINPSCGCQKRLRTKERNQKRALPDCTGERFGRLVVLGKGDRILDKRNFSIQLWRLECDCGKIIQKPRADFDYNKQISCGCGRKGKNLKNITNQKFGTLTAIKLISNENHTAIWLFKCDCGKHRQLALRRIRLMLRNGIRINCGDRTNHPDRYLEYPPTPNPYPQDASELLIKYLPLTELNYLLVDTAVEDEKRDRLLRAAWILTYRRSVGEQISELHEKRYILKSLRYCSIDVFWKRKLESHGGLMYDVNGNKKQIGGMMTDLTSNDYPLIETEGINLLSNNNPISKHLRFRRC